MRVRQERINALLSGSKMESIRLGQRTTLVFLTLPCGFELSEAFLCLKDEYDHKLGEDICMQRIIDRILQLEEYRAMVDGDAIMSEAIKFKQERSAELAKALEEGLVENDPTKEQTGLGGAANEFGEIPIAPSVQVLEEVQP